MEDAVADYSKYH